MTLYELFQVLLLLTVVFLAVIVLLSGFIWILLKTLSIAIDLISDVWLDVRIAWRNRK